MDKEHVNYSLESKDKGNLIVGNINFDKNNLIVNSSDNLTLSHFKVPFNLTIHSCDGEELGSFYEEDGTLKFRGNVDESAKKFVDSVLMQFDRHSAGKNDLGTNNSASLIKNATCIDCGWPVISACCNGIFNEFKDAKEYDHWWYCSNKGCKNHGGEPFIQYDPDWVNRI